MNEYLDILGENEFLSMITSITRPACGTCIDHIFMKAEDDLANCTIRVNISDHYATAIDIPLNNYDEDLSNVPYFKRYLNYHKLREDLENINWEFYCSFEDVIKSAEFLVNILKNKVETYTEVVRIEHSRNKKAELLKGS
ncbi:hypothetical protein HHI36_016753 [Cryptolaemus montrouzieri]|uniref:Uncharacterized protein n=1 Tax=Cryptolaemus montrouzieri TaxID=559131 RepID=A0ABD2NKP8_9CUCU